MDSKMVTIYQPEGIFYIYDIQHLVMNLSHNFTSSLSARGLRLLWFKS